MRQLWDWKASATIESMRPSELRRRTADVRLDARARARPLGRPRSRSPPTSGPATVFDRAIADFAERYADQNERDYAALVAAVKAGKVAAETGT